MAEEAARPMKYPYTLTAKAKQFPYKYYFEHSWGFRYGIFAIILAAPLFYKIQKMSYAPANVKKWEETRRKDFYGGDHH